MGQDRLFEVVLSRRVHPQPQPHIVRGGDCGACVLGGVLEKPVEFIYDTLKGKRESIDFWEMSRMLRVAQSNDFADRIIDDPVEFRPHMTGGGFAPFGAPAYLSAHEWHKYVQMAIDAGYYGLAQVDYGRKGLEGQGTDHWVLICGARSGIKWTYEKRESFPEPVGCGTYIKDVLVSCSATPSSMQTEWVDARDFLKFRGGYNILFVRPASPARL